MQEILRPGVQEKFLLSSGGSCAGHRKAVQDVLVTNLVSESESQDEEQNQQSESQHKEQDQQIKDVHVFQL